MGTRSSKTYLQRVNILPADTRHKQRFVTNRSRVHYRPIIPAEELLGRDCPDARGDTALMADRPALQPVPNTQPLCAPAVTCPENSPPCPMNPGCC